MDLARTKAADRMACTRASWNRLIYHRPKMCLLVERKKVTIYDIKSGMSAASEMELPHDCTAAFHGGNY